MTSQEQVSVTQAHKDEARRIWDAGHDKIAGQAADASWVAEQAHVETLAEYLAAAEAASAEREAELVGLLADAYCVLTYVQELAGDDVTRAALARAKATEGEG